MTTVNNLKELEKLINQKIAKALADDVAETVKDVMQEKVQTEVYDAYTSHSDHPDKYVRRGMQGGLQDRKNMKSEVIDNTLIVENKTRMADTGYELSGLVEYGNNAGYGSYDYPLAKNSEGSFLKPRPFISETRLEVSKGKAEDALKRGLKKQGLSVE